MSEKSKLVEAFMLELRDVCRKHLANLNPVEIAGGIELVKFELVKFELFINLKEFADQKNSQACGHNGDQVWGKFSNN